MAYKVVIIGCQESNNDCSMKVMWVHNLNLACWHLHTTCLVYTKIMQILLHGSYMLQLVIQSAHNFVKQDRSYFKMVSVYSFAAYIRPRRRAVGGQKVTFNSVRTCEFIDI